MHKKISSTLAIALIFLLGSFGCCFACDENGNEDNCDSFYGDVYGNFGYGGYGYGGIYNGYGYDGYYSGYYGGYGGPYFGRFSDNSGREFERNMRQVPYNPPYFYNRQKEIQRNLRQAPYYYYGHDGYLSDQEALRYLHDYNVIY